MEEQVDLLTYMDLKSSNKTPLNIIFEKINYKVKYKKNESEKIILDNVSGELKPGKLTAILGQSGSGKTSLLNVLTGNVTKGVTGNIYLNNKKGSMDYFRKKSCFIRQESSLLPLLTVKETLNIAANLKLSANIGRFNKDKINSEIIEILGLEKALDTKIGKLSGGEVKRLSIGVELITNPPVMFFDEPTSGLDSVSSSIVIQHLQTLAQSGRTIVCVVHQPSSHLFDMFDDALVMTTGRSIYSGPISDMIAVFESSGFICPQYYNRADFALEVATGKIKGGTENGLQECIQDLNNTISKKVNNFSVEKVNGSDCQIEVSNDIDSIGKREKNIYAVSQFTQFTILLKRSFLCTLRDLHLTRIRVLTHAVVGLLLGLIYFDVGNEASKLLSNSALLFFFVMFTYFANSMPTVLTFPLEADVFKREHCNNWYSLPAYFFSKMLADFPLQIICPTAFMLVAYVMSSQPLEMDRILMVWAVCVLFTILSQMVGLVTGVIFSMQMGLFLMPAISIPMLIFSGFFLRFNEVPSYMKFFTYISQFGYGFEAIMIAIYGYDRAELDCSVPYCHIRSPDKFLQELDMKRGSYFKDVMVLLVWIFVLQFLLFLALRYRSSKRV